MDTICIKLKREKVPNIDLLAEVPSYLSDTSQHSFENGMVVAGKLGNLKVIVNERQIKIENSLCKWYLNDNLKVMARSDIKQAFEKMSDLLHLRIFDNQTLSRAIEKYLCHSCLCYAVYFLKNLCSSCCYFG